MATNEQYSEQAREHERRRFLVEDKMAIAIDFLVASRDFGDANQQAVGRRIAALAKLCAEYAREFGTEKPDV